MADFTRTMRMSSALLIFTIVSCSTIVSKDAAKGDEVSEPLTGSGMLIIDLCELNSRPLESLRRTVIDSARAIVRSLGSGSNEVCLSKIIKRLTKGNAELRNSLPALEALSNVSDGYLSEELMDVVVKLYKSNFLEFLDYLYKNQNSSLVEKLTNGLSMQLSIGGGTRERLIRSELPKVRDQKKQEFLRKILEQVDPKKFD